MILKADPGRRGHREQSQVCLKNARFRGDKTPGNGRQSEEVVVLRFALPEGLSVSRRLLLQIVAVAGCVALAPVRAQAQWWRSAPADFEDCADAAEKAADQGREGVETLRMQRQIRRPPQAGRRLHLFRFHAEPDFRYRGPEPDAGRAEEDRRGIYRLSGKRAAQQHRRRVLRETATASAAAAEGAAGLADGLRPPQRCRCRWRARSSSRPRTNAQRIRAANCARDSFSCEWPRLSESLNDLKKLFGGSSAGQGEAKLTAKPSSGAWRRDLDTGLARERR